MPVFESNEFAIEKEIQRDPGVTQIELQGEMELAWGTINYHVSKLLALEKIKAYRLEPSNHLFSPDIPDEVMPAIAALRRPNAQEILSGLDEPRQLFELREECGLGKNVVRSHLQRLTQTGLVQTEGKHRPKYHANNRLLRTVKSFLRGKNGE